MSRSSKLVKNTAIYAIGNFASKLLNVVLLPIYTVYLTPEDFGQIDLYVTGASFILPLLTLQAIDAAYRYMLDEEVEYSYSQIISSTGFLYLSGFALLAVIMSLAYSLLDFQFGLVYFVYLCSTFSCQGLQQIVRGLKKNSVYAFAGFLITLVQGLTNIALIVLLDVGAVSLLMAPIVASVIGIIYIVRHIKLFTYFRRYCVSGTLLCKMVKYSFPLCAHSMCWWFVTSAGTYFLAFSTGGTEQSGVYAMGVKFTQIMSMFNTVFFLAWQESAVSEFLSCDRDRYYSTTYNTIFCFQIGALILLLPLIRIYFAMMPENCFSDCQVFLPIMLFSNVLMASISFFTSVFTAAKETAPVLVSSASAFICAFLMYSVLVPRLGAFGVVIGSSISYVVMLAFRVVRSRRYALIRLKRGNVLKSVSFVVIASCIYYLVPEAGYFAFLVISLLMFVVLNIGLIKNAISLVGDKING